MKRKISRRRFLSTTTATLAASPLITFAQAPQALIKGEVKPLVIASANGNRSKDPTGLTCVAKAFDLITKGADPLDAILAGVNIVELDPEDTSVGYGGLPNADGVVQLDASVMHGPLRRAGAVACLEGVRTPSLVARKVMDETDHHLLVGKDAQAFARNMGFTIEPDLNTDRSRRLWLEWKRRTDPLHYLNPRERAGAFHKIGLEMVAQGLIDCDHYYGTINCNTVTPKGDVAGVTTTSGLAWKIPGRVGDSPILGAGLYLDNSIGAAGSTGRGEANLFNLASFLIVELMRNGQSPKDAGLAALKRIASNTTEKRLLNARNQPNFNVIFYIANNKGHHAGVSLYHRTGRDPVKYALCTENGPQTLETNALFEGAPNE